MTLTPLILSWFFRDSTFSDSFGHAPVANNVGFLQNLTQQKSPKTKTKTKTININEHRVTLRLQTTLQPPESFCSQISQYVQSLYNAGPQNLYKKMESQ